MQYTDKYRSPLGEITLASDGDHLTGLWFDGQKYFAATLSAEHQERELPIFELTKEWLDSYFMGKIPSFTPPIHLEDTPFRLAVWDLLSKIPYGEVVTYKELAGEIARQKGIPSMSTQAIGGAVGHNPISIIIPCHRVVGSDGSLTGYAGGIDKKSSQWYRPEVIGLKTGNSSLAGACLVSAAVINGETYICVVMGSTEDACSQDNIDIYDEIKAQQKSK